MSRTRSYPWLWPALSTLFGLAVLTSLGVWQVDRYFEKRAIAAKVAARTGLSPVLLPDPGRWPVMDLEDWRYRSVRLTGRFRHDREIHLFTHVPARRGAGRLQGPGFWVITPFAIDAGVVLVNRGFVPERFKSSTKRQAGQVIGEMTLTGVIRLPERPGRFVPANQPDRNLWYSRDIEAMTRHSKFTAAAPFMVDLKTPIPPGGLPQPGPGRQTIANPHLNYAFTWFALAVCLAVIFGIFLRRRSAGA